MSTKGGLEAPSAPAVYWTIADDAGVTQLAEYELSKLDVEGSTPFTRSFNPSLPDGFFCCLFPSVTKVIDDSSSAAFSPMDAGQSPIPTC